MKAFTPTCSECIKKENLKAKEVDIIASFACIAFNDPFVMNAWKSRMVSRETVSYELRLLRFIKP